MNDDHETVPAPRAPVSTGLALAGVHDWLLGGTDHTGAEAEAGRQILADFPAVATLLEANREFTRYGLELAAAAGIGQFLDVGSGLPTCGATHTRVSPDARVVYVDVDRSVVERGAAILHRTAAAAAMVWGDVRDARGVLAAAADPGRGRARLDLSMPVCLIVTVVLHLVARSPADVLGDFLDLLAPGSMLVFSHPTGDTRAGKAAIDTYRCKGLISGDMRWPRGGAELLAALEGWHVQAPGLVRIESFTEAGEILEGRPGEVQGYGYLAGAIAHKPDT